MIPYKRLFSIILLTIILFLFFPKPASAQEAITPPPAEPLEICPSGVETPRALLVGDSWAQYMWDDASHNDIFDKFGHDDKTMVSESLGSMPDPGYTGTAVAISGSEARDWVNTTDYPFIANMEAALNANPTIDSVVVSIGGNDVLAGRSDGGFYENMNVDDPDSEENLFATIEANTFQMINAALAVDTDMEVLISSYDYPNFNQPFWVCWVYACPKRRDLSYSDSSPLITDANLNAMMVNVEGRRIGWANNNAGVFYDNSVGLMHYFYGDGNSAPGTLPYPGSNPPMYDPFPAGNPLAPTLLENFRMVGDPIHLDYDGYQYKITNQTMSYFLPKWRENPTVTFASQGGGNDGWADGVNAGTSTIKVGDDSTNLTQGIVSFDTSSLPDNAIVTSASLYMLRDGITGANPFNSNTDFLGNPMVDVMNGTFGAPAVEASDATAPATASNAGCLHGTVSDQYYALRVDLQSAGLDAINQTGLTQMRVGFEFTDVDVDQVDFFNGDATLLTGDDRLVEKTVTREELMPDGSIRATTSTILAISHQGLAEVTGSPAPFLDVTYCTPPDAPTVTIDEVGNAVELNWSAIGNADSYEVWYAVNDPYFVPAGDCASAANCTVVNGTTHNPTHDIGNPDGNYYYVVSAINDCGGGASSPIDTTRTAHFDYAIVPGTP